MASKLMQRGSFEAVDELENSLLQSFTSLQSTLTSPYQLSAGHSPAQSVQLSQALLYAILIQPASALSYITQLTAVINDGYASFVATIIRLVNESYPKLLDQPRNQILWLLRQLISFSAADVDNLCICLLRQVAGGDLSARNLMLASQLLDIMRSDWGWLSSNGNLLTTALYTYLRLLPDHVMAKSPLANELKQKETTFCIQILRERFQECLVIGRDLVRLLQDVALIPDFEPVWRDLLSNPAAFKTPAFADIAQLYFARTPTRYLTSRITPEMEMQIRFMLTHVKMGSQRRYQTWFTQRFLSTPESETLVCDLIRFICCVHHPTNQVLQSDIVPRWALVGWLLKCCKNHHLEANARLALFYDWLFFMSKTDNIMNIEPAILLMVHSIPKYVDMTHGLLEFLFLLIEHYDPARRELIQRGVATSIGILVGKGVVRSLEPLSGCSFVASSLREKLILYFAPYCKVEPNKAEFQLEHIQANSSSPFQQVSGGVIRGAQIQSGASANSDLSDTVDGSKMMEDVKPNDVQTALEAGSRKRKRPASEALLAELPQNFERLAEALKRSQEVAVTALEKLVTSFTAASDQLVTEKFAGKDSNDSDSSSEGSPSLVNHILDSALITLAKFAHQVTEILKKGGYDIFGPLTKIPSNNLEADETMSLTSSLLRLYVANRHPQVRNLLVFWDREGFAVGARLLCYVSRLAEELEQSASASLGLKALASVPQVSGGQGAADTPPSPANNESSLDSGSNGDDGDEEGEFTESSADVRDPKSSPVGPTKRGSGGLKVGRRASLRDSQSNDIHMRCRTAVADAFSAYEDFLRHSTKDFSSTQNDTHSRLNSVLRTDSQGAERGAEIGAALLTDLRTCMLWNTYRLTRVLPSVFRYLPNLATGKDELVQLLVSVLDPLELSNFEFRLTLGEFQVVGEAPDGLVRLMKKSLKWESTEQHYFWRLLAAESHAAPPTMAMQVVKISSTALDPTLDPEAVGGLMCLLRGQAPSSQLVNVVLSWPRTFGKFAAVVIANWMQSHFSLLKTCLRALINGSPKERSKKADETDDEEQVGGKFSSSVVVNLLNSLKDLENGRSNGEENGVREARTSEIRRAILQLAGNRGFGNLSPTQAMSEAIGATDG